MTVKEKTQENNVNTANVVQKKKPSDKECLRKPEFYNIWRRILQYIAMHIVYKIMYKVMYRLEVHGRENLPKDNAYIAASNHLSALDPPLVCGVLNKGGAFMAKKELFDNPFLRFWLNVLGAFAVDREKLSIDTLKTVMNIKQTGWVLGIFPQGTRQDPGKITGVTKGFANIAKKTKCAVVPIGLIGTDKKAKFPFSGKIIVRIGKPIPYSDNIQEVVDKWGYAVQELTGYEYIPAEK